LLSYAKIGLHTPQVIIAFIFIVGLLAWSSRQGSLTGFALAGIVLGLGFYTYGVMRLYVLAATLWLILYYFPVDFRRFRFNTNLFVWISLAGAAFLTSIPTPYMAPFLFSPI
jgi:predicted Kef-type K+ transport protein